MDLLNALEYISPSELDYQDWVNVGMALKQEGYSVKDWDDWSRADSRYHNGECEKKWQSFNGSACHSRHDSPNGKRQGDDFS